MTPSYARFSFPSKHRTLSATTPIESARALAHLFLQVPADELSFARLDAIACGGWSHDAGALGYASGAPLGEQLAPWLRLVITPGGREAHLDIDLEALGAEMRSARAAR